MNELKNLFCFHLAQGYDPTRAFSLAHGMAWILEKRNQQPTGRRALYWNLAHQGPKAKLP